MKKLALVTGANKGIGLETARQLARKGVHVLVGARDLKKAAVAVETLRVEGFTADPVALDVTSSKDIAAVAALIGETFGHLDILINNAGIMVESDWSANESATLPVGKIRETFDTNFFGVIELTQALLPLLAKSEAGRIVNLSSILGSLTLHAAPESPIYGTKLLAYNVSKTALNGFTVHLAHALKDTPMKVNSAHPGWVKTDMGGESAPMELADGARTSVELALLPADGPTGGFFHLGESLPF